MKLNSTLAECTIEQLEEGIDVFINSEYFDDTVRMQFLEESAKYLGVYIENNPVDNSNIRKLN